MTFSATADFNGAASVQIITNDQGNTGSGGAQSDTDTVAITVNAVNDAAGQHMPRRPGDPVNAPLILSTANENLISIGDVDAASGTVRVTLTAPTAG